jgi:hypothetical protein
MNLSAEESVALRALITQRRDGQLACDDRLRLRQLLAASPEARRIYAGYSVLHALLELELAATSSENALQPSPAGLPFADASSTRNAELSPAIPPPIQIAPGLYSPWHGTVNSFSSGWPVAYLVATLVFAIGLTIAAIVHVSQPGTFVRESPTAAEGQDASAGAAVDRGGPVVGRITGIIDCVWEGSDASNQKSELVNHQSSIRLGDHLALRSGLLEITYNTNAKVILQGPITYEVDSAAGGYLSIGRLTAKLEKRSAVSGQRPESANRKSEILDQKSSDLFAIRTPTAIVTDLGTEFGVEVQSDHRERVVVLQGRVQVASRSTGNAGFPKRTLAAGQAVKIDAGEATLVTGRSAERMATQFTRRIERSAEPGVEAIAGLVLWLKADAIRHAGNGTAVGVWPDSSQRHNHMYHVTDECPIYVSGRRSSLNNMPVLRFHGKEQLRSVMDVDGRTPGTQMLKSPFTLLAVVRSATEAGEVFGRGYFGGGPGRMAFGVNPGTYAPANSFWACSPNTHASYGQTNSLNTKWNIQAYVVRDMAPQHWTWRCNGAALGAPGLTQELPEEFGEFVYVGSTGVAHECWKGDIAELLVFNRALAETELDQAETYLARKYGIPQQSLAPAPIHAP